MSGCSGSAAGTTMQFAVAQNGDGRNVAFSDSLVRLVADPKHEFVGATVEAGQCDVTTAVDPADWGAIHDQVNPVTRLGGRLNPD